MHSFATGHGASPHVRSKANVNVPPVMMGPTRSAGKGRCFRPRMSASSALGFTWMGRRPENEKLQTKKDLKGFKSLLKPCCKHVLQFGKALLLFKLTSNMPCVKQNKLEVLPSVLDRSVPARPSKSCALAASSAGSLELSTSDPQMSSSTCESPPPGMLRRPSRNVKGPSKRRARPAIGMAYLRSKALT